MSKPVGRSLHVGLNRVDPAHYNQWSGVLNACEADARAMARLLQGLNYETTTLTTSNALRDVVLQELNRLATLSKPGDIAVFTNSSHGGQIVDLNGDEVDGADETICMFSGEIVDDELYAIWAKFEPGVRVLMISDSCHSGTVSRVVGDLSPAAAKGVKAMPPEVAVATYENNRSFYDPILSAKPKAARDVKANVLLMGGCQDSQLSMDGAWNGAFTAALLATWNGGLWQKSYTSFRKYIARRMDPSQVPSLYAINPCATFTNQRPFTI